VRNSLVVYTVRTTFPDETTRDRYVDWLRGGHCLAVVREGGALSAEVTVQEDGSVESRYLFGSRGDYDAYVDGPAVDLRAEYSRLFPLSSGVRAERSVGIRAVRVPD